jgi:hypothetical protein
VEENGLIELPPDELVEPDVGRSAGGSTSGPVACLERGHNGLPAGATGFGVRLLLALLEEMANKA